MWPLPVLASKYDFDIKKVPSGQLLSITLVGCILLRAERQQSNYSLRVASNSGQKVKS